MADHFDDDNLILLPTAGRAEGEAEALEENPQGPLSPPPPQLMEVAVEACLLAADRPLSVEDLDRVLAGPGAAAVEEALHSIADRLRQGPGGVRLVEVANGWRLRTDPRAAPWVAALRGGRPLRLSRAALETLSVVAYRQPVTRAEVEDLRGVDPGGVLRMLVERELVTTLGRRDEPGRPLLYGTTRHFLDVFGLRDLSDLPTLRDLRELVSDDPRETLGDEDDEPLGDDDLMPSALGDPAPDNLHPLDPR